MSADPINVLLVEDNDADAQLVVDSLLDAGPDEFVVTRAIRLDQALGVLPGGRVHVVLLDLSLPDSNGLQTIWRVQAAAPRVPVVVLTGLDDGALSLQAMRHGVQDYLVKRQCVVGVAARAVRYAVERARAESALHDREARLRAIVDSAVDAIVTVDERGIIESANPATERLFGFSRGELIGSNVSMLLPEPYGDEPRDFVERYLRVGDRRVIGRGREMVGRRKDGTTFAHSLSVSEFELDGRRMFTGIVRDMTAQRLLEKEVLEATVNEQRRIGQDLHDGLCQELLGIAFAAEIIAKRLAEKAPDEVARVRKLGDHVEAAIAEARAIAHGLNPVNVEADGLADALRSMAAKVSEMFNVRCRFRRVGEGVAVDNDAAMHLYRIAQESVNNAIRHGKASRIDLTLTANGRQLSLAVRDNGCGAVSSSSSAVGEGRGLKIMAYRARLIGASLRVVGRKGAGTVVTCVRPLVEGQASAAAAVPTREPDVSLASVKSGGRRARARSKQVARGS